MPLSEPGQTLLSRLESARDLLARRLAREYHTVADPDLNYVTVSSLLQILFLKTGQECGFIEPGTLAALAACDGIQKRMVRACSDAGLDPDVFFEKGPEGTRILPDLPDIPLREIIRGMDQPDIPPPVSSLMLEEFAAGLELFLGTRLQAAEGSRVIRAGKSAMLYTGTVDIPPQGVIRYVVSEAAGGITGGSTTGNKSECRILDPACGSGLFLLAAYRHLVRKKIRFAGHPEQVQDLLRDLAGRSVFGTDIDPESVSAARTVLLFAFIDESRISGTGIPSPDQIRKVSESLTKTILCGNALIAPDYFAGKPVFPFNAAERRKVSPFDWKDAFPEITGKSGFDAVIGAPPPYRPFAHPAREDYFQTHYDTYSPSAGLYGYFIERGLSLLKPGGKLIALVPGSFLRSRHARPLRHHLLTRRIDAIVYTGRTRLLPEGDAGMYIVSVRNQPSLQQDIVVTEWDGSGPAETLSMTGHTFTLNQGSLDDGGWILKDTRTTEILKKIRTKGTPLEHLVMGEIVTGKIRMRNNPLVIDQATKNLLTKKAWCRHFFVPLLRPADIRRYRPVKPERYTVLLRNGRNLRKCRALVMYLEQKVKDLGGQSCATRSRKNTDPISGLFISGQDLDENQPKIIFSEFQCSPAFFFDPAGAFAITQSLVMIPRNDPFLAGILNSTLGRFVLTQTCQRTDRGYHMSPTVVGKLPLYVPDPEILADKTRHDRMVSLVTHILELNRYLTQAKTDQERRLVQQEIDATDVRIDALVYELYGLTAEEIVVIEESSR